MRRLIVKELLENRIYLLGMLAGTAILLGLGVPLDFRGLGHQGTNWIGVVIILSMLMGVSAYSRELLAETLPFLITRPVRWWWVYLSKLLAGLIACAAIGIAAAIIYVVTVPAEYRPFAGIWSLLEGAGNWALVLGMAYAVGFLFSCVLGGTVASLVVLGVTCFLTLVLWVGLSWLYPGVYSVVAMLLAGAVAGVLSAKAPVLVQTLPRVRQWLIIMAVGLVLMAVASILLSLVWRGPQQGLIPYPSPDRQAIAFAAGGYQQRAPPGLWIDTPHERNTQVESRKRVQVLAWSRDSRTVYYATVRKGVAQIKAASADTDWRPVVVCDSLLLSHAVGDWNVYPIGSPSLDPERMWSPSGTRLLVVWESEPIPLVCMTVVDAAVRKAWRIPGPAYSEVWWLDDQRLASIDGGVIAVSAGTVKRR